ncbi:apolipoprotein N-acyltransferase [Duganella sp. FT92W]|uniref:Apolipoprotein N-acyltransferase n=1 Tax=Pseudoduganella rivuli TaxID=2666085 RepID=A0A7X2LT75_9BURK|nr:apolipoprotein N-acyltransferase [Pseudoduganella rivuli]MRV72678.1 apolipoprotein N-acyltransferase [Pseudoduganella rivuli]
MKQISLSTTGAVACVAASAALSALYVNGGAGWPLGFVFLVPWLCALDARRTWAGTLACAYAMSLAYTAAVFPWLGMALGRYTGIGGVAGLAILLLAAPLFQPQFLAFALVRRVGVRRYGPLLGALAAAAAWVATERFAPRLLGDTIGYGLYPSPLLRQAADVGGGAGLTLLLLLCNEGMAAAYARRKEGRRALAAPLACAALAPLLLALYGWTALQGEPVAAGKPLRMGLIQANMADYESQRREKGAYGVVRDVLDRHFAMSYDAIERQRAEAVLWSETAYPTTFGHPKSEAGAEFDREILANVNAARVPFVFGTYDRDGAGEYNAAALVQPETGLLGFYRKTRLFPLTEYVPSWLDGPVVRRLMPWAGNWQPGNGARVLPLRLADGREVPVLPLICRDDTDPGLALDGARLGAQVILTMSNDSWFSMDPQGAKLHQAVAAFRSIETRLPQFRVTTNGYSAAIDAAGTVLAGTPMGEPALVIADMPVRQPKPTLMVRWGDWVGLAGGGFLLLLAMLAILPAPRTQAQSHAKAQAGSVDDSVPAAMAFPATAAILPPAARAVSGLLRAVARAGLLAMCVALLLDESLRTHTLAQIRLFAVLFLVPEAIAWCLLRAFAAQVSVGNGRLLVERGTLRMEMALGEIVAVQPWRLPAPGPGLTLKLAPGRQWRYGLALSNPAGFAAALAAAGGPAVVDGRRRVMDVYAQARSALRRWALDSPLAKFVALPLVLAVPAFHLHQHIAFGSALGEYYTFGLKAYASAFALWWAAWTIGVVLCAALLRTGIEAVTLMAALLRPGQAAGIRSGMERAGHAALYLGLPAWLLLNIYRA